MGTNRTLMSALLYIPKGVTAKTPAPGIVAIHGYINSRETQDGFAIEFARRGYVVLAIDETGHGYSDPPAFANGYGGPDGLRYLRSLDIVDPKNIALEGHSMGGWAAVSAAGVFPADYTSIVLEGSSTGAPFAPEGTATFPRNLALVYSQWDEFSNLMWGAKIAPDIVKTDKLKTLFGTTDTVEIGKLYGNIADGTARKLYMPRGTHPNDHISVEAIGDAIEWVQATLQGGNGLAASDQIWYWKEIGTFIALIGMVLFLFPLGALLLKSPCFKDLSEPLAPFKGLAGRGWWVGAVLVIAIPAISYFWFQHRGNDWFPAGSFWPQNITTGIMTWAAGNGLIALVLFLAWHLGINRRTGGTVENYGVTWSNRPDWRKIGKSLVLAVCIIVPAYLMLLISDALYKTDFRLWVLAIKPMSSLQFQMTLAYLIPFAFYFLVISIVLNGELGQVKPDGSPVSLRRALLVNVVLMIGGIVLLLLLQYIPLMAGSPLPIDESLLTIVAFQFVPLLTIVALVSTYFFRKTGHIYVGAFLNAMLITWIIVAAQATHFAF
jgi:pimeloyl-ACP methyl ester carboxylesterase